MKYIRTIVGVYKTGARFKLGVGDSIYVPDEGLTKIIKASDSLPDLCDYIFYKIRKSGGLVIVKLDNDFPMEELKKAFLSQEIEYAKLAILTDKGLIYVAELNDRGEFKIINK